VQANSGIADSVKQYAAYKERSMANVKDMRNPYMPGRGDSCGCQGIRPEQAGSKNPAGRRAGENCPCTDRMGREMRMPNRMEHRLPMQGCQENMRLVPENRMSERRLQSVQNQQCNKSRYIADVYELGFVMVETALYLDTHPDDGEALAFYADMKHQYAEAVRLYNENVGPLSFYHVTNENYWNWVATPMPWEMEG
jgi:spore coat protein JB